MKKKFLGALYSGFVIALLSTTQAFALEINCRWTQVNSGDTQGEWKYECDTVPDLPPDDVLNGNGGSGGGPSATGGQADNSAIELPKDPSGVVDWIKVFKTVKDFCKKPSESCTPEWTTRMTAGTASTRAICQRVGIALQGVCNAEAALEASFGCPNVSAC